MCGKKHKMNIRFCSNCGFEKKIYHDSYDVFISYRRDLGSEMATLIKLELEKYGKIVFLDVTELQVGRFDEKLLQVIESCNAFLLILSLGCLDRCMNKSDWLKREIVHAFKNKKKIIPVIIPGFEWPDKTTSSLLPVEMNTLPQYQAVEYSHVNRREAVRKILEYIAAPQVVTSCDDNDSLHQGNESLDKVISMSGEQLDSANSNTQHQGTNFFNEDVSLPHTDKLCSLDREATHLPAINTSEAVSSVSFDELSLLAKLLKQMQEDENELLADIDVDSSSESELIIRRDGQLKVVVLDDKLVTDSSSKGWPDLSKYSFPSECKPPWIVLKRSNLHSGSDLWENLQDSKFKEKLIVLVSVDDLRRSGAMINTTLSWEQTVENVLQELHENHYFKPILNIPYLVINFRSEGAFWFDNSKGQQSRQQTLVFNPGYLEGEWEKEINGQISEISCLSAGLIKAILQNDAVPNLVTGLTCGLKATRVLLRIDHGAVKNDCESGFPISEVAAFLGSNRNTRPFNRAIIPELYVIRNQTQRWSLTQGNQPLYGQACQVALKGVGMLKNIPYSRFGTFYSVDRSELENLRGIRQLFHDYVMDASDTKPLSIGVFAPPHSGQGFVIQSVVREVLASHVEILEFNLDQFDRSEMLFNALRQVRDRGLEGKIPVVFWHEFDTRELTWLRYFITSIQDGTFFEDQIICPVGKCIFVFAGSTSSTMEAFCPPQPDENEEDKDKLQKSKEVYTEFKNKKGPDFVSHLRGYVNVMGLNPRQIFIRKTGKWETDPTDICFPIRRVLLLRAMAGLYNNPHQPLAIDTGLLNAFLKIGKYTYGVRSLETIVSRTKTEKKGQLLRSNLPPREQISLHVDYDEFFDLIQQDMEFQAVCGDLARHIHGFYQDMCQENGWTTAYDVDYDKLPLEIKDDNVAAACRISKVISLIFMQVVKKSEAKAKEAENIDEAIKGNLELLAEAEHDGWMEQKLKNGWLPTNQGEKRNDKLKIHDCLVPYFDLSEKEKDKDRDSVTNYPKIVDCAGYMIVYEE